MNPANPWFGIPHDGADHSRVATVTAKTRKRCPRCAKMVEKGEAAILTDDRWIKSQSGWNGHQYQRGAFHLWHPACRAAALEEAK